MRIEMGRINLAEMELLEMELLEMDLPMLFPRAKESGFRGRLRLFARR
jgi:hypothetical protein